MLNKNEIKLAETRAGQLVRRLPFTETGYVQLVLDYHFDGIAADHPAKKLTVNEISPIARLMEDDFVLEQCFGEQEDEVRFELFRFTGGRLRSLSLATNLHTVTAAMERNPAIGRWMCQLPRSLDMHYGMDGIFQNESWSLPTSLRASRAALKAFLSDESFWRGEHSINPMNLIMSFHKLQRLYSKQTPLLHKRNTPRVVEWSEVLLEEKGVHYFNTNGHKGEITDFKAGQVFLKVTEVAELGVADTKHCKVYPFGNVIYSLELVEFKVPESKITLPSVGLE